MRDEKQKRILTFGPVDCFPSLSSALNSLSSREYFPYFRLCTVTVYGTPPTCLLSLIEKCKGGGAYTVLFLMFDFTSYCKNAKVRYLQCTIFLLWTRARAGFPYKYPGKHCSFEAHQEIPKTYFCASIMSKIT